MDLTEPKTPVSLHYHVMQNKNMRRRRLMPCGSLVSCLSCLNYEFESCLYLIKMEAEEKALHLSCLRKMQDYNNKKMRITEVEEVVCHYYGLDRDELNTHRRFHRLLRPKQVAMLFLRYEGYTMMQIGQHYGLHHATILNGLRLMWTELQVMKDRRQDIQRICLKLRIDYKDLVSYLSTQPWTQQKHK